MYTVFVGCGFIGAVSKVQIGLHLVSAIRTDAMAEADIGTAGDVTVHAMPIVAVVTNLVAVATYRQKPLQRLDGRYRLFQFSDASCQRGLELNHACADLQACAEFGVIERLRDVVVR